MASASASKSSIMGPAVFRLSKVQVTINQKHRTHHCTIRYNLLGQILYDTLYCITCPVLYICTRPFLHVPTTPGIERGCGWRGGGRDARAPPRRARRLYCPRSSRPWTCLCRGPGQGSSAFAPPPLSSVGEPSYSLATLASLRVSAALLLARLCLHVALGLGPWLRGPWGLGC